MKKTAFILPGFNESPYDKKYLELEKYFRENNFKTHRIVISWKNKTINNYENQIEKQLKNYLNKKENNNSKNNTHNNKTSNITIFGFSFGALLALKISNKIKIKNLILCSISPYFKEDLEYLKKTWKKTLGKKRIKELNDIKFSVITKKITANTIIIYGEKEYDILRKRNIKTNKIIKNSKIIIAKESKHNIENKNYKKKIKNIIQQLP